MRKKYERSTLSQKDRVLEMARRGPVTIVEVAKEIGVSRSAAATILNGLVKNGQMDKRAQVLINAGHLFERIPDKRLVRGPWRKHSNEALGIVA